MSEYANLNLERQVLGQMIRFSSSFDAYTGHGLTRADFFRAAHRTVFDAIAAVVGRGVPADLVSVGLELRALGALEDVGAVYFSRLPDDALLSTPEGALLNAATLAELAGKREVFAALSHTLEDVVTVAEQATARAANERRVFDAAGQLRAVETDTVRDAGARIWLGFPTLDGVLEGVRPGEVFGLMARPGIGKTLVLCHVTRTTAEYQTGHVFFSLEMPAPQIVDRIAGAHYGLSRRWFRERLSDGRIDPQSYLEAFRSFVLVDAPGLSVAQMAAKLRQIQAGPLKGIPIRQVTVDHLGLIGGDRKMATYDRVSTQARELKELAKRFECAVVLAVQVNRDQGGDGSKELGLGAARDSGVVEEALDYLVALRRLDRSQTLGAAERERYRDVLFAKVVKHRHGATDGDELAIRMDGRTLALTEDLTLKVEENDNSRIASMAGRQRR